MTRASTETGAPTLRKASGAWAPFAGQLAQALAQFAEGQFLLARLNDLNRTGGPACLFLNDDAVLACSEIPAEPFVPAHVAQALHAFCARCDGLGPMLERRFGGRLVPGSDAPGPTLH
jgi:hypothetical protein